MSEPTDPETPQLDDQPIVEAEANRFIDQLAEWLAAVALNEETDAGRPPHLHP